MLIKKKNDKKFIKKNINTIPNHFGNKKRKFLTSNVKQ